MLFQIIEDHIYIDGQLRPYEYVEDMSRTWSYNSLLGLKNVECAQIWAKGKNLDECCPEDFKNDWTKNKNKIKAFIKSYKHVGMPLNKMNLIEIVPEKFIKKLLSSKNIITEHVFSNFDKPRNHDFMYDVFSLIGDISKRTLKLDFEYLKFMSYKPYVKNLLNRMDKKAPRIVYKPYGTVTGRLSIQSGSFPILNLAREARKAILPKNDCFLELDFNSAELRVFLALNDKEQPENDIHDWNAKNIFKENMTRDEIKKKTFAWLYNPKAVDKSLEMCYNKKYVLEKYFDGNYINTIFHRKIKSDDHHALNYIIQSTTSDLFLKQAIKIFKMLKGKKTNVAFTIHDSLVLDFHLSDKGMVERIIEEFSDTSLGKFKVNISGGRNFGEMKEMNL